MSNPSVQEVFVPGTLPTYTYVDRGDNEFEEQLRRGLKTPGKVVSISGPSKSGKTVLVRRVVGDANLINVKLSGVNNTNQLWRKILNELGAPSETESYSEKMDELSTRGLFGLDLKLPSIGGVRQETEVSATSTKSGGHTKRYTVNSISDVIEYLKESEYILLLDDFHKVKNENLQEEIAGTIKEMTEEQISICVALVPHRSDDLTKADPDLRGRVQIISMEFWEDSELRRIADLGFDVLNVDFPSDVIRTFVKESAGSPQLMQQLCLSACYELGVNESKSQPTPIDIHREEITKILKDVVKHSDHRRTIELLDNGPKVRGEPRNTFDFANGSGDVYRAILKAISGDPPKLSYSYEELKERVDRICIGNSPSGSSINRACKKMNELMVEDLSKEQPLEWDDSSGQGRLTIPDPYLLYHLRWSNQIEQKDHFQSEL
ncbi:hypothetical protein [Halalkalicoccus sp. NIPERK01]|uniref:hypothetical protein n=1 Tax=Halalkalicoccus sp. NIPERK01 TaxID=3053469 RepID=UPI00256F3E5D|nr:hypothetical protein [Halalkalicoccus sp. NIPERK01]MDL5362253.1 hypothetical protein [Halalkalicoccus sp. NIPERK01]